MSKPKAATAHTLNPCDVPPWVIGSQGFNAAPRPIEIQGVRRGHRFLFERLGREPETDARARLFHDYVAMAFQLHQWSEETTPSGRRSLRNRISLAKIFFRSDLLPVPVLKGKQEVLVIGGEYEVHVRTF